MREALTAVLDVLGVLLVAAAVAFGLFPQIGWWSVGLAGVLLLGTSQVADALDNRPGAPREPVPYPPVGHRVRGVDPPPAGYRTGAAAAVSNTTALRHSAVWACLRLRADLISTLPVDAYRKVEGVQVEVVKPPVLVNPGGERVGIREWLYSTQFDLDRSGNCFGVITERNALGLPARIDLVQLGDVSVSDVGGELTYRFGGDTYRPADVWHEAKRHRRRPGGRLVAGGLRRLVDRRVLYRRRTSRCRGSATRRSLRPSW